MISEFPNHERDPHAQDGRLLRAGGMICPRCEAMTLTERERDGVVIDVCTRCRGIWLDRGELEKLIARATRDLDELSPDRDDRYGCASRLHDDDDDDDDHDHRRRGVRRKRRWYESLGDIFD
jgi:Zn-finger nucleic acid-binding protein